MQIPNKTTRIKIEMLCEIFKKDGTKVLEGRSKGKVLSNTI